MARRPPLGRRPFLRPSSLVPALLVSQQVSLLLQIRQLFRRHFLGKASNDGGIHPFDRRYGVDTSGLLYADALSTGHARDGANEGYYATAPSLLDEALALWQTTLGGYSLEDYTFIDLGCGKGRVVLLAAGYPFRAVTGIELNPELARTARANLRRWPSTRRACLAVQVVVGDILELKLLPGPVVLYLFNAFDRSVARAFLARLEDATRSRTAPIDLIYMHPDQADLFEASPVVEVLADADLPFSQEDAAADAFEVDHDQCQVFRLHIRD